jgi:hypothetical protein
MRNLMTRCSVIGIAAMMAMPGTTIADEKSRYSIFNPTPDRLLREMTTDRPDTTESPFTVDAGRIQIETGLFGYTRSRADIDGIVVDTYELATTNIRVGLTHNTEINIVWQPYGVVRGRHDDPALRFRDSGIGGLDLRVKVNLWGNDTPGKPGKTALALLPYVTLPTDRHNGISPDHVEGGLIVPFSIDLTDKFGLGINTGVAFSKDGDLSGYDTAYIATASLAYAWNDKFGTYHEIATELGGEGGDVVILATGMTYAINDNVQLDAGVNFGVTSASDRINPFLGISTRF